MFLKTSRYYKQEVVEAETGDNSTAAGKKTVNAVSLRRLPQTEGSAVQIKSSDRLDIMAQRQYNEPTMFWYIADANSELQANHLVEEPGQTINVPEQ